MWKKANLYLLSFLEIDFTESLSDRKWLVSQKRVHFFYAQFSNFDHSEVSTKQRWQSLTITMNTNSSRAILELENNENFELLFAVYLMEREKRTLIEMFP